MIGKLSTREKRIFMLTLAIALIAIVQLWVAKPVLGQIRHVRAKASITAQDLARLNNVLTNRQQVEKAYESIRNRITSTKTPEREIIEILQSVQQAAEDSKIEILLNVHTKDEPQEYFNIHTINFQGRGELPQFIQMLARLQNPQLGLKVTDMRFALKNFKLEMELVLTRVVYSSSEQTGAAQ
ncbi:MAG: hypothetical protein ABFD69_10465 [Candidatus Sumerlaeia bacterium]